MAIAFEASFPGTPLAVRALRRETVGLANDCGLAAEGIAAVRLAVTEAAPNAVSHACAAAQGALRFSAGIPDGELTVVIGDTGRGLVDKRDGPGWGSASPSSRASCRPEGSSATRAARDSCGFRCPNAG